MTEELSLAEHIAQEAFKDKTDLAGEPYIFHLERVEKGVSEGRSKVVALLHDLLEDCPEWNETSLGQLFSRHTVRAVVAITKSKGEDYETYLHRVRQNITAREVKKADLLDNMDITRLSELKEKDFKRLQKYLKAWRYLNFLEE